MADGSSPAVGITGFYWPFLGSVCHDFSTVDTDVVHPQWL